MFTQSVFFYQSNGVCVCVCVGGGGNKAKMLARDNTVKREQQHDVWVYYIRVTKVGVK